MASNDSNVIPSKGPTFQGVTLHDPNDPEATMVHYPLWRGGRMEESSVASELLQFAGRNFPVTSFGDPEMSSINATVTVPAGDEGNVLVDALRDFLRDRRLLVYRDGRGRVIFGTMAAQAVEDRREGTDVTFTVTRNDYSEVV